MSWEGLFPRMALDLGLDLDEPDLYEGGNVKGNGERFMKNELQFLRLPIVLIGIFFVGRLVMGAAGASYEAGNRVFSMVILETHLALIWGALGRRYGGYRIGGAAMLGVLIALATQILILGGTVVSELAGIETYFNDPIAITGVSSDPIGFPTAVMFRAGGLVVNCVMSAILAALGWALGGLIPERA